MLSFFYEYWPELFELGFIHISSAPLYEVDVKFGDKKKETIFCIDDKDYEDLIKRVEKGGGEITRKKRNKGLGETGKEAMKFAVEECMTKITIGNKKKPLKSKAFGFIRIMQNKEGTQFQNTQ